MLLCAYGYNNMNNVPAKVTNGVGRVRRAAVVLNTVLDRVHCTRPETLQVMQDGRVATLKWRVMDRQTDGQTD